MKRAKSAQRVGRRNLVAPNLGLAARALLALALCACVAGAASAQTSRPVITVPATTPAQAATEVPLRIRVGPPGALPRGSFVRVQGLPPLAALSEGHSIAPGSWAVPLAALPDLRIMLPVTATGRSEIAITLVALDGAVLGEAKSVLVVSAPPAAQSEAAPSASASILRAGVPDRAEPPAALPRARGPTLTPDERERALRLVKRGNEQLAEGGVAQARLFYERAAEAGLAEGAMAMAATYDAAELARLGVLGLQPDRNAARRWYERAQQLGSTEAERRLSRLGAN